MPFEHPHYNKLNYTHNPIPRLMALLVILLFSASLIARPELGPPSIKMKSNISNITVMKLVESNENGLTFIKMTDIHNQAPDKVFIKHNTNSDLNLKIDQNYIIGYMAYRALKPSKEVIDRPGGPVLMNLSGAEPALFLEDENIKKILMLDVEQSLTSPPELLQIALDGLNHADPHSRSFFIAELITRPSYMKLHKVQNAIKKLILDDGLSWSDKHFIVAFGGLTKSQLSADWFCQWSENTLRYSSTQFDVLAMESGLIKSLMENISNCSSHTNFKTLSRWLNSNHSGVIESAINELRKIDLYETQKQVKQRIANTLIRLELRATLTNYLRRLENEIKQSKKTN